MAILCFITAIASAQSADTLKVATIREKSEAIISRMERELSLTKGQSSQLMTVLTARFQRLERSGLDDASLATANQETVQKLAGILSVKQYALYQELRAKKRQEQDKYLKEHPGFAFSKEDLEMDF